MRAEAALGRSGPGRRVGLLDQLELGTSGLRSRRLRAALSALGIAVAVATVILVTAIPASSQAALDLRLRALGSDLLRIDPLTTSNTPVTLPPQTVGMLERIGAVRSAAAAGNTHAGVRSTALREDADGVITTLAVDGSLRSVVHATLQSGVMPWRGVVPTVTLGAVAAEQLGIPAVPSRAVAIDIGGVPFQVVGVLHPVRLSPELDTSVLVDRAAAVRWLRWDGRPTVAYATGIESELSALEPVLAATLSPRAAGLVQVTRPSDALTAKRATQTAFSGIFLGLAAVALAIGGLGIANTMFVAVLERRREIGLRRALGARRADIRLQFLIESTALCLLGGAAGAAIGATASAAWALTHRWPVVVPATTVVGSAVAVLLIGLLAGLGPSMRAARQDPAAALSAE